MKKILVIDETPLLREFLQTKLHAYGFEVVLAVNGLDGSAKLRRESPDLVIMDYYLSRMSSVELLEAKKDDPNTANVPVIMASSKIDRETLVQVARFNVRKFFNKPLKMDTLVKSIGEILGVRLEVDTTPCIVEAHFNDQILFVEVAQGLNTEKIELLKYKIAELLEIYNVKAPKVLVIMASLDITADDSLKLGVLFNTLLDATGSKQQKVKVLTNSEYVSEYIQTRDEFREIEITANLEDAMDSLLGNQAGAVVDRENNTVQAEFLQANEPDPDTQETIHTRFEDDQSSQSDLSAIGSAITLAVVDDDFVIREMIKAIFSDTGFTIKEYEDGKPFIEDPEAAKADLVLLDLMMPEMDGFQVMAELQRQKSSQPVIVLSALGAKETVVKALGYGIHSYVIKPPDPETILMKAKAVLRSNF